MACTSACHVLSVVKGTLFRPQKTVCQIREKQREEKQKQVQEIPEPVLLGDPYENRTRVTAVKGPCLNRLTNGPWSTQRGLRALAECCHVFSDAWLVAVTGFEPVTLRV